MFLHFSVSLQVKSSAGRVADMTALYGKVVNLDSDPMDVTFFCDTKSFITWHDPSQAWVDTRFTYEHQGVTKTIAQYKPAGPPNPNSNPGNQGSFTLNGQLNCLALVVALLRSTVVITNSC